MGSSKRFCCTLSCISILAMLTCPLNAFAVFYIQNGQTFTVPGTQASPWNVGQDLFVGVSTDGTLHITSGGIVSSVKGSIAALNSIGVVTISGTGAQWNTSDVLYVGYVGTGTLDIFDGGSASSFQGIIGNQVGSIGATTVSGAGSQWIIADIFGMGAGGTASMDIINGGLVSNTNANIATNLTTGIGKVTVSGVGSTWLNSDYLSVGSGGNGTLEITNSGLVESASGMIGLRAGSVGTVTVNGLGSLWHNLGALSVGTAGSGILNITDSGVVSSTSGLIGELAGSSGTVAVSGTGSQWNNTGALSVGTAGNASVEIANQGHVSASNVTIANNAGSSGTLTIGGLLGTAPAEVGTLTTSSILFGAGDGRIILNHTSSNYVFDATLNGGANNATGSATGLVGSGLIDAVAGRTIFNSNQGDFTGTLQANDQGILQINGNLSGATAMILAGGQLEGNGIVGNTTNAGIISPGNSIGALTVDGNYVGNNGALQIESVLGNDSSATDKLLISGNASGTTTVRVSNLGGLGDTTINGINIIDVGGLAPDGTFLLAGDYITGAGQQAVIAGAYAYTLQASGNAAVAGRNWSLSSELLSTEPGPGPDFGPDVKPGSPRYQPGVPLYEQYPQVLAALNTLPTLQQRVGNRYWSQTQTELDSNNSNDNQWAWGRIEGSHQVVDPVNSTSSSNRDIDVWKLQTGIDVPLHQGQDGSLLTGGVNFSYGKAKADISSYFGYGNIDTNGYGVGTTLTWYSADGVYIDGQLQTMWFDSDLNSTTEGHPVANGNSGRGYASSVETGKHYQLGNGFSLTPQLQLTYSRVDFDTFRDPYGSEVSLQDGDSLRGRAGVSLDKENVWIAENGTTSRSHLYSNLDVYNEFLNGTKTRVSGIDFTTRDERQSVGVGAGGTYEWQNGRYGVYGNVNLITATRNVNDNYAIGGTVGVRVSW